MYQFIFTKIFQNYLRYSQPINLQNRSAEALVLNLSEQIFLKINSIIFMLFLTIHSSYKNLFIFYLISQPITYISINMYTNKHTIDQNMAEDSQDLVLQLKNINIADQQLFGSNDTADIILHLKRKGYYIQLHSHIVKKKSQYFYSIPINKQIVIGENFDINHLSSIFQLCYGFKVKLDRANILSYYDICQYFEMPTITEIFRNDISKNLVSYDIFIVIQLALKYHIGDILDMCFRQLLNQNFQQFRYNKYDLLQSPLNVFKKVIVYYNKMRSQGRTESFNWQEIQDLCKQYSENQNFGTQETAKLFYELIDHKQLFNEQNKEKSPANFKNQGSFTPTSKILTSKYLNKNIQQLPAKMTQSMIGNTINNSNNKKQAKNPSSFSHIFTSKLQAKPQSNSMKNIPNNNSLSIINEKAYQRKMYQSKSMNKGQDVSLQELQAKKFMKQRKNSQESGHDTSKQKKNVFNDRRVYPVASRATYLSVCQPEKRISVSPRRTYDMPIPTLKQKPSQQARQDDNDLDKLQILQDVKELERQLEQEKQNKMSKQNNFNNKFAKKSLSGTDNNLFSRGIKQSCSIDSISNLSVIKAKSEPTRNIQQNILNDLSLLNDIAQMNKQSQTIVKSNQSLISEVKVLKDQLLRKKQTTDVYAINLKSMDKVLQSLQMQFGRNQKQLLQLSNKFISGTKSTTMTAQMSFILDDDDY